MNPLKMILKKPKYRQRNPKIIYDISEEMQYRGNEIRNLYQIIDVFYDNDLRIIDVDVNHENGDFGIIIGIATNNYAGRLLSRNIKIYPNNLFKNLRFYITKDTELADFITEIFVNIDKNVSYASYLSKEWKVTNLHVSEDQGMLISFTINKGDVAKIKSKGFGEKDMLWLIMIYINVWLRCQ